MSKCSHMTQWLAGRNLRLSILILFSEIPYIAKTGKKTWNFTVDEYTKKKWNQILPLVWFQYSDIRLQRNFFYLFHLFFFRLSLIIVILLFFVFFCIWISIFIKNYNLCFSNHNLGIPGLICLKFWFGNSKDPQECF